MAVHASTFTLFTADWWKAALVRAVRTALVAAVPYIPTTYAGITPLLAIASVAGMGFILSLATSLTGLSEADGKSQAYWVAIVERVTKTFAQALVAGFGTAVFLTDVDFPTVLQTAAFAAFGSLVLAVIAQLPEAGTPPTVPVTGVTSTGVKDTRAAVTAQPYETADRTVTNVSLHSATSTPASEESKTS